TVVMQGVLGGITVLWYLPDAISIAHASLAQIVFCLTTTIALVTSPGWKRGYAPANVVSANARQRQPDDVSTDRTLHLLTIVTTPVAYARMGIGATMRHTGAGLPIPDSPSSFGHVIPPHWDSKIAIHFAHRVGAAVAAVLIVATAGHVFFHHPRRSELRRPAI